MHNKSLPLLSNWKQYLTVVAISQARYQQFNLVSSNLPKDNSESYPH